MKSVFRSFLALPAFCATLGACSSPLDSTDVEIAMWEIDAQTVPCMALVPTTCLRIRENPSEDWGLFYDPIQGFTFEPGFRYKVEVEIREIKNPPADGASASFRLLRLIEKRAVSL